MENGHFRDFGDFGVSLILRKVTKSAVCGHTTRDDVTVLGAYKKWAFGDYSNKLGEAIFDAWRCTKKWGLVKMRKIAKIAKIAIF